MTLKFKEWLNPVKNRVVVYDFDGTIANVPERPSDWKGKDWWGHNDSLSAPHYDGGVNDEVVAAFKSDKQQPNTRVILLTGRRNVISHKVRSVLRNNNLYGKRVIPDSNPKSLEQWKNSVASGEDIEHDDHLHGNGHEEYYSGDHVKEPDYPKNSEGKTDHQTIAFKLYIIGKKMMNPAIETLEFWDDRQDHVPHFIKFGLDMLKEYGVENGGKLKNVIFHRVFPPNVPGQQGQVIHVPIKPGMVY